MWQIKISVAARSLWCLRTLFSLHHAVSQMLHTEGALIKESKILFLKALS